MVAFNMVWLYMILKNISEMDIVHLIRNQFGDFKTVVAYGNNQL